MYNSILSAFQGLSQNCCFPPDVQVAAGKKYLLEMVNLDGAIYTKDGTLVKAFGLERFFNPSVGNKIDEMTGPVLLFDNLSGKWFASISDITEHSIRVAVSKTDYFLCTVLFISSVCSQLTIMFICEKRL
jgi:hypothetical protein